MKITQEELYSFITEPYLSRGKAYFKEGLIELISIEPDLFKAWAIGTRAYKVSLRRTEKTTEGYCTCPAFEESHACKHIAAMGFAVIKYYECGYEPSHEYFEKAAFFRCR